MKSAKSSPANNSADGKPVRRPLPDAFVNALTHYRAFDGLADALAGTQPVVSVRVNPLKAVALPDGADRVPWCADGMYLPERPAFTLCPELHQGLFYVQDASSMILQALAAHFTAGRPVRWLDACAAPGGKTTAIISALHPDSLIVANEYDRRRAEALVENMQRWGSPNVMITTGDTAAYSSLDAFFDFISVDAPCSGEGMMRKDDTAVAQWSPRLVESCAVTQRQIIGNLWPALRPGGILIYSTCTFNTTENEDMLQWMTETLGAEPLKLPLDAFPEICGPVSGTNPCTRFIPSRLRGEGLFVCAVRRPGNSQDTLPDGGKKKSKTKAKPRGTAPTVPPSWLNGEYLPSPLDPLQMVPAQLLPAVRTLSDALPPRAVLAAGVTAAIPKGRDLIPAYQLAQNTALNPEAFVRVPVTREIALHTLHGDTVTLPDGTPRGIVLLTYGGHPLAFANNIGTRANNLVPASRRIQRPIP